MQLKEYTRNHLLNISIHVTSQVSRCLDRLNFIHRSLSLLGAETFLIHVFISIFKSETLIWGGTTWRKLQNRLKLWQISTMLYLGQYSIDWAHFVHSGYFLPCLIKWWFYFSQNDAVLKTGWLVEVNTQYGCTFSWFHPGYDCPIIFRFEREKIMRNSESRLWQKSSIWRNQLMQFFFARKFSEQKITAWMFECFAKKEINLRAAP